MQESQRGCLRPALYMLQTLPYVEKDHTKLRVSRLLDIASFPWKLLPVSYFKSPFYTHLSLPCLLCKKLRTVADPGTGLWAVDRFPLSSPLPLLLPSPCNKQNYPMENPTNPQSNSLKGSRNFCSHCWCRRYSWQLQTGYKSALGKQSQTQSPSK